MTIAHTASLLTAVFSIAAPAVAGDVFPLSSATFEDGDLKPKKVGDIRPRGPNCEGENVSPELSWASPTEL